MGTGSSTPSIEIDAVDGRPATPDDPTTPDQTGDAGPDRRRRTT
jgi:hypothetical protein